MLSPPSIVGDAPMHLLSHVSLRNRPFTALVSIVLTVFGFLAMLTMRQELIPSVELPQVQIIATDPGATSQQMRDRVAKPLEQSMQAIENVEGTQSTSTSSLTRVTVDLTYGTDVARASNQVDAMISRIEDQLPENLETTVISGGSGDIPAAIIAVSSDLEPAQLSQRLSSQMVPELERIDGVASVVVAGGPERIVRITPNQEKLAAAGLSTGDIQTAIDDNGLSVPGGTVQDGDRTLDVTVGEQITTLDDLKALPLKNGELTLADVATVEDTTKEATSISRTNGRESLVVLVLPTVDANLVQVSQDIEKELKAGVPDLGGNATSDMVFDQAPFIQSSITALAEEGLLGLVFAIAVILLFLLAVRPTIVTALSIPLSLLMAFVGMMVSGYTLNMLTMAALTISVGRVVDDSIVVIENITRHLSYGTPRMRAIITAVREVGGAITASTLATVIVFLPIAVVSGMAGELFRPFALTVAIAMLSSLFVSLTIVPVLAYWFLRAPKKLRTEEQEDKSLLNRIYAPVLRWTQQHSIITLVLAFAILVGTVFLTPLMKVNLLGDTGQNMAAYTQTMPNGTSLEATAAKSADVEKAVLAVDGVQTVQTTIGASELGFGGSVNEASYAITTDVNADQEKLRADILAAMESVEGAGEIQEAAMGGPAGTSDVTIEINAATAEERKQANDAILAQFDQKKLPEGVKAVTSDLTADQPTAVITVDRAKAAQAGLSDAAVVGLVSQQLRSQSIGTITLDDADLSIELAQDTSVDTFDQLKGMSVAGRPLTEFATITEENVPPQVTSVNNREQVTISLTPEGDDALPAAREAQQAIDAATLPETATARVGGASQEIDEAFTQIGLAILAAVLLTYVLLVWIFKSLIQPLILLISIPFAAVGAFGLLIITQVPLGLPSMIGLLMLVGIVVTNAIVLIDLVNQRRRAGMPLNEAILDGAQKRLRPILMTAAATIFALIPMALGITGQSGFISQPLAVVVIGGLISSTLLTLVIVPVLYRLSEGFIERRRRNKQEPDSVTDAIDAVEASGRRRRDLYAQ